MRQMRRIAAFLLFTALTHANAAAQGPTVYASVLATKLFVVGAANPETGVFYQRSGADTLWSHTGAKTIRAFSMALPAYAAGRVIYIAAGNGVHLSRDGGRTWKITTDWRVTEVMCVVPDPRDTSIAYCTTPYGVFRTTDGCATWSEMNRGLTSLYVSRLIITPSGRLICATQDGLFASGSGGKEWERMPLSVGGTRTVAESPRDPDFLIAGTEEYGLYVSHDGGGVWTRAQAGIDHLTFYTVAFDPSDAAIVYAGGYVTGVYKSGDGGKSWRRMNEGLANLNVHGIAVDPVHHDRVYAATLWGGVFRSDDGGALWRSDGLTGSELWNIIIEPF